MIKLRNVTFTQMRDGTEEDYLLLRELEGPYLAATADRILRELARAGEESLAGYRVTRLEHALQSATRAEEDGADIDWVVAALLHDIGDGLAPQNHDRLAAEIIRPFLRDECTWVVEHHGAFQLFYYGHFYGWNRLEREKHRHDPRFQSCVEFCERWDQASFDDGYKSKPLAAFEPVLREVFARLPYQEAYTMPGVVLGLPAKRS